MAIYNKPDENVFASSAKQGEVSNFPDIGRGWGISFDQTGGIPPMEWFNFLFKRNDERFGYLFQRGLSEWSGTQEYPVGALVQYKNLTYKAKRANTNKNPDQADSLDWQRWGFTQSELKSATINESGITQLLTSINSDDETKSATPKSVKMAYDKGNEAKIAADNANSNANARVAKSGDSMTGSLTIVRSSKFYKVGHYNWGKFIDLSGDAVIGNDKCVIGFNNNGTLHLGGKPNAAEFNASIDESMLWVRGDVQTKTGKSLNKSVSIDDFTTIKSENGWAKLPTGLIIQWGQFLPSNLINNETGSITFPQRYPNSVFCVICGSVGGTTGGALGTEGFAVTSQWIGGFNWISYWEGRHKRDFPEKIQWISIGY